MVTSDTRNNIIIVIALVLIALAVVAFIFLFSNSLLQVADKGEKTINLVGKSVAGNISKSAEISALNLNQFNKSINDVVTSNDEIIVANNKSLANLSKMVDKFSQSNSIYLSAVTNNTGFNKNTLGSMLSELKQQTIILQDINKKLDGLPVVPITPTPANNSTGQQKCMIKTPTVCILPNGSGIIITRK